MPEKEGDDEKKSTKSVVNKRQKQFMNQEDYIPEQEDSSINVQKKKSTSELRREIEQRNVERVKRRDDKAKSMSVTGQSAVRDSQKYASGEYPKIGGGERPDLKSKGGSASTGESDVKIGGPKENPKSAGGKSKGNTPVKVNIKKKPDLSKYFGDEYIPEEGYDIARDMGKVRPSKDKKDATTMPVSKEMRKTQKVNKGPSALELVKKKYGKAVMKVGKKKVKEELDLTKVAEAFGGYIIEQPTDEEEKKKNQQQEKPRKKFSPDIPSTVKIGGEGDDKQIRTSETEKKKLRADRRKEAKQANTTTKELDKRFKGAKFDTAPFARRERQYDTPMKDASGKPVISKQTDKPKREPKFLDQRSKYNVDPKTGIVPKSAVLDRLRNRLQSKVQADLQGTDPSKALKAKPFKLSSDAVQDTNKEIQQQTKKRVDSLMKEIEKQPLDTSTGKGGALDKRLKAYQDATNPTIPSATGKGNIPMPGGFDADGGRTGTKKQQKAYDAAVESGKNAFYKDVAKGGVKGSPLDPTETNLQFKYDKAQSDIGGKVSPKASAKEMEQTKSYLRKRGFKVPGEIKPKKDNVTVNMTDTDKVATPKPKPKLSGFSQARDKIRNFAKKDPVAALATYDIGKGILGKIMKARIPNVPTPRAIRVSAKS